MFGAGCGGVLFGPTREKVMTRWKKLNNEELHDFVISPDFIRVIKSIWAGIQKLRKMRKDFWSECLEKSLFMAYFAALSFSQII
jgi:hypothetical protein